MRFLGLSVAVALGIGCGASRVIDDSPVETPDAGQSTDAGHLHDAGHDGGHDAGPTDAGPTEDAGIDAGQQLCSPEATQACTCVDGSGGTQACNGDGTAWGACNNCLWPVCTPQSTMSCTCGSGAPGISTCNGGGTGYGECSNCAWPVCTPSSTMGCTCSGGANGIATCNGNGTGYGSCGSCTWPVCTPSTTIACTCANGGAGTETCNSNGTGYGACGNCADPCGVHVFSCAACTADNNCGWCPVTQTCQTGTSSGASDGSCPLPSWNWINTSCFDYVCTANDTRNCVCDDGVSFGTETCNSAGTSWGTCAGCPSPCVSYANCGTCQLHPECGWCIRPAGCVAGTQNGSSNGSCSGTNWAWSSCP